jgi:Na+/H+ antiporter NhaA
MGPPWARVVRFVFDNSILLVVGTVVAVTWANLDTAGYEHATHPLHLCVNDVGMVFFFALAAKEVFEATLPGGPLASVRQAASPLAAAVGGMVLAETKMGALLSFGAAPLALLASWLLRGPVQMTGIAVTPGDSASPSNRRRTT